jgi:hypothetical protein
MKAVVSCCRMLTPLTPVAPRRLLVEIRSYGPWSAAHVSLPLLLPDMVGWHRFKATVCSVFLWLPASCTVAYVNTERHIFPEARGG